MLYQDNYHKMSKSCRNKKAKKNTPVVTPSETISLRTPPSVDHGCVNRPENTSLMPFSSNKKTTFKLLRLDKGHLSPWKSR